MRRNAKGPEAAGVIHGDFERGFIRAETIAYPDFVACNGEQDGDVMHFRFNV